MKITQSYILARFISTVIFCVVMNPSRYTEQMGASGKCSDTVYLSRHLKVIAPLQRYFLKP